MGFVFDTKLMCAAGKELSTASPSLHSKISHGLLTPNGILSNDTFF